MGLLSDFGSVERVIEFAIAYDNDSGYHRTGGSTNRLTNKVMASRIIEDVLSLPEELRAVLGGRMMPNLRRVCSRLLIDHIESVPGYVTDELLERMIDAWFQNNPRIVKSSELTNRQMRYATKILNEQLMHLDGKAKDALILKWG